MDAILQTLIGGMLALGGALIGPFFQRKHERWRAEREDRHLLRDKAQELFDELDRVIKESQAASISAVSRLKDDSVALIPVPDLGRIRAIAAIYFPSSLGLIENLEIEHVELGKEIVEHVQNAVEAGEKGLGTLKGLPVVMAARYQEFAARFVATMRTHLIENVPKIELDRQKSNPTASPTALPPTPQPKANP